MDHVALVDFIDRCPIIDAHAHNVIQWESQDAGDLQTCVSEANGRALTAVKDTLPFLRATRQLCEMVGLDGCVDAQEDRNDWQSFLEKRSTFSEVDWTTQALAGIQTVLVDDGLRTSSPLHPYDWFSRFTRTPAKRIIRVETLAEDLILNLVQDIRAGEEQGASSLLHAFEEALDMEITRALMDEDVVGFKSAICYRTGLSIDINTSRSALKQAFDALVATVSSDRASTQPPRINAKPLNDHIVRYLARRIVRHSQETGKPAKPLQFHTGFGDSDLTLSLANPSCLQPFIEANSKLPILLLHASYPFAQEAAWLATLYDNVYLDLGLIFPMVSRAGQEATLRQALEIAPSSKLCWSTDGHFFQEGFALATLQVRQTLKEIIPEMVRKQDVTYAQAANVVKDLLFETANKLYKLNLPFSLCNKSPVSLSAAKESSPSELLQTFLQQNPSIRFIRVNWIDYSSIVRTRVFPAQSLLDNLRKPGSDSSCTGVAAHCGLFSLADDSPGITAFSATGEVRVVPDFRTIHIHPRKSTNGQPNCASIMAELRNEDGSEYVYDTRRAVRHAIQQVEQAGISQILLGSEIEFCLFETEAMSAGVLRSISNHTWSTAHSLQAKGGRALDILESIVEAMQDSGIQVEQWHSESGLGQYEIALGPLPPLAALDQLVHAREIITYIASEHGYQATMIPKPDANSCGNGAHLHMSVSPPEYQDSFFAGILSNLPAICGFTLPSEESYQRVGNGKVSGGTWVIWGEQNREAPLRRVDAKTAHWELKAMDGLSNVYLAVAALLHAGKLGIQSALKLPQPCNVDASLLSEDERSQNGINTMLPLSQKEALTYLAGPEGQPSAISRELGLDIVQRYVQVKQREAALLKRIEESGIASSETDAKGQQARKIWLMERY